MKEKKMSDFDLSDAVPGGTAPTVHGTNPQQPPNWSPNPWGQYPGAPGAGQAYPGAPGAGQAYPGAPGAGQPYPGAPGAGQPYPGAPGAGQPYPGAPGAGQPYPGAPGDGNQFPGAPGGGMAFPLFPGAGQTFPGFSGPTPAPTGPSAPQPGAPSAPVPQPGPAAPLKMPFDLPLPAGIMPRLLITCNGAVNKTSRRFTFDFKRQNDIAFHFNVRFDEAHKVIVRNSMMKDRWGSEEREAPRFPFEFGKPFQIQFLCEADQFKVAVNGEHLLQFKHRVTELNQITVLSAYGDVTLTSVTPTML
ncbi:hypothetical protein NDU88_007738 [Pleurodeles waltl]|uniref:Galectin n=2 Tax=Pleurodeles waltl TaxID=8319 RepID=A0AAV7VUN9_PLEWA|nr:hypothetical protein NDU88_007738 [Pleurodeles waltl]